MEGGSFIPSGRRRGAHPARSHRPYAIARVEQIFPGTDGLTRVVSVRITTTTLRRPVSKIVKLLSVAIESSTPYTDQE